MARLERGYRLLAVFNFPETDSIHLRNVNGLYEVLNAMSSETFMLFGTSGRKATKSICIAIPTTVPGL